MCNSKLDKHICWWEYQKEKIWFCQAQTSSRLWIWNRTGKRRNESTHSEGDICEGCKYEHKAGHNLENRCTQIIMIYTLEEGKETDVTCEKEKQSKYMREICAAGIPDKYKIFHVRVFLWIRFFFTCLQTLTFGHSVCSHAFKNDLSKIGYGP